MLRLVCPSCRKDSFSSEVESFKNCPYCGAKFSGRYGIDKRHKERKERELPVVFSYDNTSFQAQTIDFSDKGLGIKISGNPLLARGETIELTIGDLQIRAKIIWVKNLNDNAVAGLMKVN
ncbi:MAG: PilZ domain-containing protein [Nitrospira sp.]|nr:PilZ domain-containing protein [Nitrospira sp.]